MLQKNGRTVNQNRVFGWIAHWYPNLIGSGLEAEIVALLDECRGLQRLPFAPDIETARAMRAQHYAIAERIFDKHEIERNRVPALENLKSMMRKCNRFFNCDDPEIYRASVIYLTKVPRHGARKVVKSIASELDEPGFEKVPSPKRTGQTATGNSQTRTREHIWRHDDKLY